MVRVVLCQHTGITGLVIVLSKYIISVSASYEVCLVSVIWGQPLLPLLVSITNVSMKYLYIFATYDTGG